MSDNDSKYPGQILCPHEDCEGMLADDIGDDTRGRHYYWCANCGGEWLLAYDDPQLLDVPPVTSIESQVYIDGGLDALRAYRKDGGAL